MTQHYDADRHHRRSIRLRGYDYAQSGAYFLTICTINRACLFGDVIDGVMQPNMCGQIVEAEWLHTAIVRPNVMLDAFVVMPNHVHGIVIVNDVGTARRAPTIEQFGKPVASSLPTIVRAFKSAVTKRINEARNTPGVPVWQRNYYEHVIRDEADHNRIRAYIAKNPARWMEDTFFG